MILLFFIKAKANILDCLRLCSQNYILILKYIEETLVIRGHPYQQSP